MKKLLWCCQHAIAPEQKKDLSEFQISFLSKVNVVLFKSLSNCPASVTALKDLAFQLSLLMANYDITVLPIGSPAFNFALNEMLMFASIGVTPFSERRPGVAYNDVVISEQSETFGNVWFAHSIRDSYDEIQEDGSVKKVSVFKHAGWIKFRF